MAAERLVDAGQRLINTGEMLVTREDVDGKGVVTRLWKEGEDKDGVIDCFFVHGLSPIESYAGKFAYGMEMASDLLTWLSGFEMVMKNGPSDLQLYLKGEVGDLLANLGLNVASVDAYDHYKDRDSGLDDFTETVRLAIKKVGGLENIKKLVADSIGSYAALKVVADWMKKTGKEWDGEIVLINPVVGGLTQISAEYLRQTGQDRRMIKEIHDNSLLLDKLRKDVLSCKNSFPQVTVFAGTTAIDEDKPPLVSVPWGSSGFWPELVDLALSVGFEVKVKPELTDGMFRYAGETWLRELERFSLVRVPNSSHLDTFEKIKKHLVYYLSGVKSLEEVEDDINRDVGKVKDRSGTIMAAVKMLRLIQRLKSLVRDKKLID